MRAAPADKVRRLNSPSLRNGLVVVRESWYTADPCCYYEFNPADTARTMAKPRLKHVKWGIIPVAILLAAGWYYSVANQTVKLPVGAIRVGVATAPLQLDPKLATECLIICVTDGSGSGRHRLELLV